MGCHSLLQGIFLTQGSNLFLTQGSNLGLLHCKQILYHLSHQRRGFFSILYFLLFTSLVFHIKTKSSDDFCIHLISFTYKTAISHSSKIHIRYTYSQLSQNAAAAAAKSLQSCPTLCDPRDGSPPGSTVPGILQARTLEWLAISFSNA